MKAKGERKTLAKTAQQVERSPVCAKSQSLGRDLPSGSPSHFHLSN